MTESTSLHLDPALAAQRAFFADVLGARSLPKGVTLSPVGPPELLLTELRTAATRTDAVIFWIHGGGYVAGTVRQSVGPAARVARAAQMRLIAADYPLAPEHPYPAALDQLMSAYRWVFEEAQPGRVVVAGESAWGGLALALLQRAHAEGLPGPRGLLLLSPALDLTASGDSFQDRAPLDPVLSPASLRQNYTWYAGGTNLDHPGVSPLFGDLDHLPESYVQVGTAEILLDDAVRLASAAAHADAPVILDVIPGGTHGLQGADTPLAQAAVARAARFLSTSARTA